MAFTTAKIYVRAERDGDEWYFGISVLRGGHDYIVEDIDTHLYLDPEFLLSKGQMRLPDGSVVRLVAKVAMVYTRDYWGECDSDLEVDRVDVLKVSKPSRKQTKKWAFRMKKGGQQCT